MDPVQLNIGMWCVWCAVWCVLAFRAKRASRQELSSSRLVHLAALAAGFSLLFTSELEDTPLGARFLPDSDALAFGFDLVTLAGLGFMVWARLHLGRDWSGRIAIKEGHRLVRSGPYRLSRHPIYTGFLGAVVGSALAVGTWQALLAVPLIAAAYVRKIRLEEAELERQFGAEYVSFRREVKALVPFVY